MARRKNNPRKSGGKIADNSEAVLVSRQLSSQPSCDEGIVEGKQPEMDNDNTDYPFTGAVISFQLELSSLYHHSRASFYNGMRKWFELAILICGCSAFASLFVQTPGSFPSFITLPVSIYAIFTFIITIITILDINLNLSKSAYDHAILARLYDELLIDLTAQKIYRREIYIIKRKADDLTKEYSQKGSRMYFVEYYCQNFMIRKHNLPDKFAIPLSFWQGILKHFTNVGADRLKPEARLDNERGLMIKKFPVVFVDLNK